MTHLRVPEDDLRRNIRELNLATVRDALLREGVWDTKKLARAQQEYRRFLLLCGLHPKIKISPVVEVDKFWHAHILDTERYHRDCMKLFGRYLHHNPNFGTTSKTGAARIEAARRTTLQCYRKVFRREFDKRGVFAQCSDS